MEALCALVVMILIGLMIPNFCSASTTVAVCQYEPSTTINCPGGINVISARYGRYDTVTCVHPAMSMVGCGAAGVFEDIQSQCQGEISCDLAPSNGNYGDPCPNTFKYLEVTYDCFPEQTTTKPMTTTEVTTTTMPITTTTATPTTTTTTAKPTTTTITTITTTPTTTTTTTTTATPTSTTTTVTVATTEQLISIDTSSDQQTTTLFATIATFLRTNSTCTCNCRYTYNTTFEGCDLLCTLAKLKQQLSIDRSTLSSFKRTKICAYDGRASAQTIGFFGALVLSVILGALVAPDVIKVSRFIFGSNLQDWHAPINFIFPWNSFKTWRVHRVGIKENDFRF